MALNQPGQAPNLVPPSQLGSGIDESHSTNLDAAQKKLDPYTSKATDNDGATVEEKVQEFMAICKKAQIGMLTTLYPGKPPLLHSRAMVPVSTKALTFTFVSNAHSSKNAVSIAQTSPAVNISYCDPASTDWVSIAGDATLEDDREEIKKVWNAGLKAWFGDLGDGVHKGDHNDPRVQLIVVKPKEIHYWHKTSNIISETYQVVKGAVTGETAAPGVLRSLTKQEIDLVARVDGGLDKRMESEYDEKNFR